MKGERRAVGSQDVWFCRDLATRSPHLARGQSAIRSCRKRGVMQGPVFVFCLARVVTSISDRFQVLMFGGFKPRKCSSCRPWTQSYAGYGHGIMDLFLLSRATPPGRGNDRREAQCATTKHQRTSHRGSPSTNTLRHFYERSWPQAGVIVGMKYVQYSVLIGSLGFVTQCINASNTGYRDLLRKFVLFINQSFELGQVIIEAVLGRLAFAFEKHI